MGRWLTSCDQGGCCYRGGIPQPTVAMGPSRRDDGRGQARRQGLRAEAPQGGGRQAGQQGTAG